MLDSLFGTGKLDRMIIWGFVQDNPDAPWRLSTEKDDQFQVQVNPDSYTINHNVHYTRNNATGGHNEDAKVDRVSPETLDCTIIFDATGVIPKTGPLDNVPIVGAVASVFSSDKPLTVMEQIGKFTTVVYKIKEPTHQPRKVRLTWGPQTFDGVLSSMSLNYKLFDSHGTPLQVEARVNFESAIPEIVKAGQIKTSSPDLTHVRTVVAGDTLPLMTNNIYGTPNYYIEVAKSNRLFNFRKLKEGRPVYFPPAKKTAK